MNKYLIVEYYENDWIDDSLSDDNGKHYVMHTDKPLMTHAQAVDEYSRLCKEHVRTKFVIYKIYEH